MRPSPPKNIPVGGCTHLQQSGQGDPTCPCVQEHVRSTRQTHTHTHTPHIPPKRSVKKGPTTTTTGSHHPSICSPPSPPPPRSTSPVSMCVCPQSTPAPAAAVLHMTRFMRCCPRALSNTIKLPQASLSIEGALCSLSTRVCAYDTGGDFDLVPAPPPFAASCCSSCVSMWAACPLPL